MEINKQDLVNGAVIPVLFCSDVKTILMKIFLLFFSAVVVLGCRSDSSAKKKSPRMTVSVKSTEAIIETDNSNNFLNFDFIIENTGNVDVSLNAIELSIFDSSGKLCRRDYVNLYSRKSLELPEDNALSVKQRKIIYNPFPVFNTELPLTRMHYDFYFNSADRKHNLLTSIDVFPKQYKNHTSLILPLKGRILVWDGHDYNSHHRRMNYADSFFIRRGTVSNYQRYGYDFVLVDSIGKMYRGKQKMNIDWYDDIPDDNNDYLCFGVPVYAAGDGEVADARDGVEDDRKFAEEEIQKNEKAYGGNYIIIKHSGGEYSWFGHLRKGSVKVRTGDIVKQGQIIAAVGASGNSLFPHLHYELRNGSGANHVEGLPSYFRKFTRVLGSRHVYVNYGLVNSGDIIESK